MLVLLPPQVAEQRQLDVAVRKCVLHPVLSGVQPHQLWQAVRQGGGVHTALPPGAEGAAADASRGAAGQRGCILGLQAVLVGCGWQVLGAALAECLEGDAG